MSPIPVPEWIRTHLALHAPSKAAAIVVERRYEDLRALLQVLDDMHREIVTAIEHGIDSEIENEDGTVATSEDEKKDLEAAIDLLEGEVRKGDFPAVEYLLRAYGPKEAADRLLDAQEDERAALRQLLAGYKGIAAKPIEERDQHDIEMGGEVAAAVDLLFSAEPEANKTPETKSSDVEPFANLAIFGYAIEGAVRDFLQDPEKIAKLSKLATDALDAISASASMLMDDERRAKLNLAASIVGSRYFDYAVRANLDKPVWSDELAVRRALDLVDALEEEYKRRSARKAAVKN